MDSSGPLKQRNFLPKHFFNLEKKFLILAQNWSIFQTKKKNSDLPEKPDFPPETKMIILTLKKQYLNWKSIFHPRKKFPILTKNKQCSKQKNVLYLSEKNFPNQNKYYFTSSIKQFSKWRKFLKFVREKQNFLCISEQKISHTCPKKVSYTRVKKLISL